MSSSSRILIECPKCKKETETRLWNIINSTLNPEMKQKILDGTAFRFICPECGYDTVLDYGFLYHDMKRKLMVYYVTDEKQFNSVLDMFCGKDSVSGDNGVGIPDIAKDGYTLRIVTSFNEMREKIHISDAGYDDRVMELAKVFYYVQLTEQDPDFNSELMFFRSEDGNGYLELVGGKNADNAIEFTEDTYKLFSDRFLAELEEDCYIIDQNWAVDYIHGKTEE